MIRGQIGDAEIGKIQKDKNKEIQEIERRIFDLIGGLDNLKTRRPTASEGDQQLFNDIAAFKRNLYNLSSDLNDIKRVFLGLAHTKLNDLNALRQAISDMLGANDKLDDLKK